VFNCCVHCVQLCYHKSAAGFQSERIYKKRRFLLDDAFKEMETRVEEAAEYIHSIILGGDKDTDGMAMELRTYFEGLKV